MTHGVLTNAFHAEYDYEAIDRDYIILRVTKESRNLDRTNVLDIPLLEWKACAVQYSFGRDAFVLFRKGSVDVDAFRMQIQEHFPEVSVRRIDVLDAEARKDFYYNDRLLAQLLMNSLKMPQNDQLTYHNLTGKLFYLDPSWILKDRKTKRPFMLYALEVHLSPGMYLKLKVKTFKQKPSNNYSAEREYILDPKTHQLRKRLKSDEKLGLVFTEGSFENKRNTVDYLNFQSFEAYRKCKLGVLYRILRDVKEKLGAYLTLTPQYREDVQSFEIPKIQKRALNEEYLTSLMKRPFHLIDDAGTERSAAMAEQIRQQLKDYYGLTVSGSTWNSQAYHIRLIHDEEYYSERKLSDPHSQIPYGMIVQHMTEEQELQQGKRKATPAINKVLQELLIKEDVQRGKLRLFDWKALCFEEAWTFVQREKIPVQYDRKRKNFLNRVGDTVFYNYLYTAVAISPDGTMKYEQFRDDSNDLTHEQEMVIYSFEAFHKEQRRVENVVEGLVYRDIKNIHAIISTPLTTMPAIDAIWNGLENSDSRTSLDREQLLAALEEFKAVYIEAKEQAYAEMLCKKLHGVDTEVNKAAFKQMMDYAHNRKAAKACNRFLHGNYGILVLPECKNTDFEDMYWLENVLDIKYYIDNDHLGRPEFHYFVGTKRKMLQTSLHNACIVRKVISMEDAIDFQKLMPFNGCGFCS